MVSAPQQGLRRVSDAPRVQGVTPNFLASLSRLWTAVRESWAQTRYWISLSLCPLHKLGNGRGGAIPAWAL